MEVEMPQVIPAGLRKCHQCGEYRGRGIVPSHRHDLLDIVPVSCLCQGIVCRYCKRRAIHRPISNYYDGETGQVWHVPYFAYDVPCPDCRPAEGSK
jgi:hypothetical protein